MLTRPDQRGFGRRNPEGLAARSVVKDLTAGVIYTAALTFGLVLGFPDIRAKGRKGRLHRGAASGVYTAALMSEDCGASGDDKFGAYSGLTALFKGFGAYSGITALFKGFGAYSGITALFKGFGAYSGITALCKGFGAYSGITALFKGFGAYSGLTALFKVFGAYSGLTALFEGFGAYITALMSEDCGASGDDKNQLRPNSRSHQVKWGSMMLAASVLIPVPPSPGTG